MQADTNEVMAASVVYLSNVDVDRPLSKAAWNNSQALRHFSILRKLDGVPFPAGAILSSSQIPVSGPAILCVWLWADCLVLCMAVVPACAFGSRKAVGHMSPITAGLRTY